MRITGFTSLMILWCGPVFAQDVEPERQAVIDPRPFGSSRDDAHGTALSPFADGMDAPLSNPAGIGGVHNDKNDGWVRQLHFPYTYGAFNDNSSEITENFTLSGGASEVEIKQAIDEAAAGSPIYGRGSIAPNVGVGRFVLGPIYDTQLAAIKTNSDADTVDLIYQKQSGAGAGFSIADPKGNLYFGGYAHYLSIERTSGIFTAQDVADLETASSLIESNTAKYAGLGINAGMLWTVNNRATPVVAISIENAGGTEYEQVSGPEEDYKLDENISAAFGVSPEIFSNTYYNFGIEMDELTDGDKAIKEKWQASTSVTFGGRGIMSVFGLNLGANSNGASFGSHLNIGLIGLQYANFAVDVGTEDNKKIERRQSAVVSINLAK